jgi:hypothetical protein
MAVCGPTSKLRFHSSLYHIFQDAANHGRRFDSTIDVLFMKNAIQGLDSALMLAVGPRVMQAALTAVGDFCLFQSCE